MSELLNTAFAVHKFCDAGLDLVGYIITGKRSNSSSSSSSSSSSHVNALVAAAAMSSSHVNASIISQGGEVLKILFVGHRLRVI